MTMMMRYLSGSNNYHERGIFHVIALAAAATITIRPIVQFVARYFIPSYYNLKFHYENTWAIVTGGTQGIGLEIAKLLAASGVHVVLMARDEARLREVAVEIEGKYHVQTRTISVDATHAVDNYLSEVKKVISSLKEPISMLFNNVGVHNDVPANITEMLPGDAKKIITVNCLFQVEMTALVLPFLRRPTGNNKADKSIVVNVSSLTSQMAMPMLSVYSATKAFEEHFSTCIAGELQPEGIDVLCLRPGITVSRMSGISTPSFFCPSAEVMARACLRMLGKRGGGGMVSYVPYWPHALLDAINAWVPASVAWSAVRKMHQAKREEMMMAKATKKDD